MIQTMELKPLCSLILEKTLNDPDKYQSGLTKIFFRAGMLAALESLRSEKLNALVTVVQKNMRRRMAVKKYHELRRATIKIQTWWRGISARRFVESIRRNVAAVRLQTGIRRFIQRSNFLQTRHSIILFQSRMYFMNSYSTIFNLYRCRYSRGPRPTTVQRGKGLACCYAPAVSFPWIVRL
jgi:myosin-5